MSLASVDGVLALIERMTRGRIPWRRSSGWRSGWGATGRAARAGRENVDDGRGGGVELDSEELRG